MADKQIKPCPKEPVCPALHTALHDMSDLSTRVYLLAEIVDEQGEEIKRLKKRNHNPPV